jgi:hypothetical protein
MVIAAGVLAVAAVTLLAAYASRTEAQQFEGRTGTVEELLDFTPHGREFTSVGIALLTMAAVAACGGAGASAYRVPSA